MALKIRGELQELHSPLTDFYGAITGSSRTRSGGRCPVFLQVSSAGPHQPKKPGLVIWDCLTSGCDSYSRKVPSGTSLSLSPCQGAFVAGAQLLTSQLPPVLPPRPSPSSRRGLLTAAQTPPPSLAAFLWPGARLGTEAVRLPLLGGTPLCDRPGLARMPRAAQLF